ncbi:MAG: magnesium transporter CorA family protein [Burkholderiaceae bacterium]
MDIYLITEISVTRIAESQARLPSRGFLWLDATHDEVAADAYAWRDAIERMIGTRIVDPHLIDAVNLGHPSYFDSTQEYEMVVFRKLSVGEEGTLAADAGSVPLRRARKLPTLRQIATIPVTFFLCDRALITVSAQNSTTINQVRTRLLDFRDRNALNGLAPGNQGEAELDAEARLVGKVKSATTAHQGRPPSRPEDLMLRLLNAMVDRYLALRQPLTDQLDRWQRELLDPKRMFSNWYALLDARIELRKLENLCEEQRDALQEFRDNLVDGLDSGRRLSAEDKRRNDVLLVRANDVMEHVQRVLHHAARLQDSIESAIQLHFSATAHRTNEIVRLLTIITAIFAPLTLITGIFGMNFKFIPGLDHPDGFYITLAAMVAVTIGLLIFFQRRRVIDKPLVSRRRKRPHAVLDGEAETVLE